MVAGWGGSSCWVYLSGAVFDFGKSPDLGEIHERGRGPQLRHWKGRAANGGRIMGEYIEEYEIEESIEEYIYIEE